MAQARERDGEGATDLQRVTQLLGGDRVLRHAIRNRLDAHEMLSKGLPGGALNHLVGNLRVLKMTPALGSAVGVSLRTLQRRKGAPSKPLDPAQSGQAWKFAEILARATEIFGSQEEAEQWLDRPAIGLNQHRPIELLATPAGVELVEEYLGRIEYGVYT